MAKAILILFLIGAASSIAAGETETNTTPADAYAELSSLDTLSEVMRHLYRWYLDETDFAGIVQSPALAFGIHPLHPELDDGDKSLYGEIEIPSLGVLVRMKKADYRIEELGTEVKSQRFKIVNVERSAKGAPRDDSRREVNYPVRDMMDYLFRTRSQPDFPSPELSRRLGDAVADVIRERFEQHAAEGDQTVFVSPLSPVANEIWLFWQDAKMLIRWASDIELDNPAVWDHESLAIKTFDIEEQVVLSFHEAAGSNAFVTRDQVGRALYNCVILGQKRTVPRDRF